ncbi:MAG: dipeptidyl aminopeptidase/acylaminoacyl peptidase [Candidatus Binatia bacterium]|jgi:dipeptidyl aminopeptidase/acylaminoacyl peptidase
MDVRFECPNLSCRQAVSIGEDWVGRFIKCPRCGASLEVPATSTAKADASIEASGCEEGGEAAPSDPGEASKSFFGSALRRLAARGTPKLRVLGEWALTKRNRLLPLGAAALLIWIGWSVVAGIFRSLKIDRSVAEICAVGEFRDAAVGDHSGNLISFIRITPDGRVLFLKERGVAEPRAILPVNLDQMKHFSLLGWSPDDRYLMAAQRPDRLSPNSILYVFDGRNGTLLLEETGLPPVESLAWTRDDEFVFMDSLSAIIRGNVRTNQESNRIELVTERLLKGGPSNENRAMVAMGPQQVGFVQKGNLWSLKTATKRAEQLSSFTNMTFEWLDYSPEKNAFLFCAPAAPPRKYPRVLYRFDLRADKHGMLRPLTESHTYNGRWILNGGGYAYVGSEGNENYLAVHVAGDADDRYLFEAGFIRAFSVDGSKQRLLAFASSGIEPHGIWEYDIRGRALTNLVVAMDAPFESAKVLRPHNKSLQIRGRRGLPYTLIPPRDFELGKKYPAVIDGPNSKRWRPEPQALANAGIYYIAANRRGLASSDHFNGAAEDIASLHEIMSKHPSIDPDRIFLMGTSYGTQVMIPLIRDFPELWRGVIMHSPVVNLELHENLWSNPRYLITIGENDKFYEEVRKFEIAACHHLTLVDVKYYPGMGHGVASTEHVRDRVAAAIDFILEN